jgi:hypothetical protein
MAGSAAVFGQRSPSIVYDTGTKIPADALFLEYQEESGDVVTVEVFRRAGGSTLITAFSDGVRCRRKARNSTTHNVMQNQLFT